MSFNRDYHFGEAYERINLDAFKHFFKDNKICRNSQYSVFDYSGDKCHIELKSRRNKKEAYPTTMMPLNKIERASKCHQDVYFCIQFTDGLYYWKYNKDEVNTFQIYLGGRTDRGRPEIKQYVYIPIEYLKLISI